MPPARRPRRGSRAAQANLGGILMIVAVVLIVIVGLGIYGWQVYGTREVDRLTGCPKQGLPTSVTAVLLDVSDPMSAIQTADFNQLMEDVKKNIPKLGKLELYSLAANVEKPLVPEYAGCNPGSGQDVASPLTGNQKLADRRWTKVFSDKVDAVLNRIASTPGEDRSPILESIQSISITAFGGEEIQKIPRTIIIVSDLIQYTKQVSFYQGAPDFDKFSKTPYFKQIRTDLHGANVVFALIRRDTRRQVQNPRLQSFWMQCVTDQNGVIERWYPIKG